MGESIEVLDPLPWGLPPTAPRRLSRSLFRLIRRFRDCFKTCSGNTYKYAEVYLKGLVLMSPKRNYANIARRVIGPEDDGQNLQQFMSDSPWKEQAVFDQIQAEILTWPEFQGGSLILDECGFERSGDKSAGASRQYLGRFGKVDMGQVGVCLGYYKKGNWVLVDGELFMPEVWFDEGHRELRRRHHVPEELEFRTKPEIGLEQIRRAKANGLPFEKVLMDALYGKKHQFRADLDKEDILYIADVTEHMVVHLEKPTVGFPKAKSKMGRPRTRPKVLSGSPVKIGALAKDRETKFQTVVVREAERGTLIVEAHARWVWTLTDAMEVREEWLLISKSNGELSYSLSNYPEDTPLEVLVRGQSDRYFVERIFEDEKSENGWDEFQALKYRAWQHNTALVALALWFITTTKLEFERDFPRDPRLKEEFELEVLPALSVANVREMLKAALPLPKVSMDQSCELVAKHLVNRSRSTRSRKKKKQTTTRGP